MSIGTHVSGSFQQDELEYQSSGTTDFSHDDELSSSYLDGSITEIVGRVRSKISPVWPLKDYVAVNPYAGFADEKFLEARHSLRQVSNFETLMGMEFYRKLYSQGKIEIEDIEAALEDLVEDELFSQDRFETSQILGRLENDSSFEKIENQSRILLTYPETLDGATRSDWHRIICEEVSKHCASHFDQGQATWISPWKELPLYQAWRSEAQIDRSPEVLGLSQFRKFVAGLPHQPHAALDQLLDQLEIPESLREAYLLCVALALPGWSAWAVYQDREAEHGGLESTEFAGLLAIQLAYAAALLIQSDFHIRWGSDIESSLTSSHSEASIDDEVLIRMILLKASEISFRKQLLGNLNTVHDNGINSQETERPLAQMVFCIDVRSERIRRHLETVSDKIETFGFAGFFGLPIEYVPLGNSQGCSHVPVLISPQFKLHEEVKGASANTTNKIIERKSLGRFVRKAWKEFQSSAAGCFSFVESTGIFYGAQLIVRSLGWGPTLSNALEKFAIGGKETHTPTLRGLHQQGITTSKQTDLAESMLRGIGLVKNFGRLVIFCGHASQTENNPLKAGLDCGACGGHSGEPNARLAARLLNQQSIRQSLKSRGIEIPDDTVFAAALHNTTTDNIEFFEIDEIPPSHLDDLQEIQNVASTSAQGSRLERLVQLPGASPQDLIRRSRDWAEVRPEWGLAGNAAFVAAPRSMTNGHSLEGRVFLHSYDYLNDPNFSVLEQIMTAPLIVAHWINMQYYASTVDPQHLGSGSKTIHNVIGKFGILSGNSGDLKTGLPWQSVHDGFDYRHQPVRLQAVIAAPRQAIEEVIDRHKNVEKLLTNGWLHLVAIDDGQSYRFTGHKTWKVLSNPKYEESYC